MSTQPNSLGSVVPGVTTGTTPPILPGGEAQAAAQPTTDKVKQLMAMISQAANRKQAGGTPIPQSVPQQDNSGPSTLGMNTANPHAWGTQRFLANLSTSMRNAVAKSKENQVLKAEGDWTYLQSSLNELYSAQQSGDPKAVAAAQSKVDATLGDQKKLKNMAKALNQDWLNPEKTTVYGEALKKVTAQQQQKDQTESKKQQAAQGLKGLFQKLLGQNQQLKLDADQQKQLASEIQAKAPVTTPSSDDLHKSALTTLELAKAMKDLQATPDKFEYKTIKDTDGSEKIVAIDKTDPTKPYIEVKSQSGEKARPGDKKYVDDGKLEIVGGLPTGRVKHGGKFVAPGQEGYTAADKDAVKLGYNAAGLSDKQKERLAAIRGESFARSRALYTFHDVVDKDTGEVGEVSAIDMARNPGKYSGASEQEKVSARDAVHESLNTNFAALGKSLDKLPNGLDTETQALLKKSVETGDPGLTETLIVNKFKAGAPDEVLQYLTDVKAMQEDIMTLRSVGGMGQGSDSMRHAMVNLIPGPGTGSVREAKMQISAAKRTSEALFSGRPESRLPTGGANRFPGAPKVGTVVDGYKFKGGDPAKKENWEK